METRGVSRVAPELWTRLAGEEVRGETLWACRAAPDVTERVLAALDAHGERHLLLLLKPSEVALQDTQSRGLSVKTRDLAVPGHKAGRYLDVVCHDATGYEAFDLIGWEIAERLARGNESAPEVIGRVLSKWRRFWGQLPLNLLSREELLGLFAELWFFSVWLVPKTGVAEAVRRWRGPFGSRHDFERVGLSVEVKATSSTRGLTHHINGIDQLAPPENGRLLFFSLRLHEEGGSANTLVSVISTCHSQLLEWPGLTEHFDSALLRAGYSPAYDDEYAKVRLRVVEESLFEVRDDFPRLTRMQLVAGVPPAVEHLEYAINLSGFNHLCIAHNAAEAPEF
jgi:hypothetical protein